MTGVPNSTTAPLLEARGLSKHYGPVIALESVDFRVEPGITGLLGPNGAGKSTAIKLFLGLLRPTAGAAEIMGQRPYESVEARARLGYSRSTTACPPASRHPNSSTTWLRSADCPPPTPAPAPPTF